MKKSIFLLSGATVFVMASSATAQFENTETQSSAPVLANSADDSASEAVVEQAPVVKTMLPSDTIIVVTPSEDITSKKMKEGTTRRFQIAEDVKQDGVVVIPRGSPVVALVTWRTGKGIGGKSAKFEVTFQSVTVGGKEWALKGKHRQEGRGNTAAALLGSMIITGRSATMGPGQLVNVFTAEDIVI